MVRPCIIQVGNYYFKVDIDQVRSYNAEETGD